MPEQNAINAEGGLANLDNKRNEISEKIGRKKVSHHQKSNDDTDAKVEAFWTWFASVAAGLSSNFEDQVLLGELDAKLAELGVAWELGPGQRTENVLAISPDGAVELLPLTEKIVSMAPLVPGWAFISARPRREANMQFSIGDRGGATLSIDASEWRYVLLRFGDGKFKVVLEQPNLRELSEEERYTAAVVFLDGTLGEATRLRRLCEIEVILTLPADLSAKANRVGVLAAHLDSRK